VTDRDHGEIGGQVTEDLGSAQAREAEAGIAPGQVPPRAGTPNQVHSRHIPSPNPGRTMPVQGGRNESAPVADRPPPLSPTQRGERTALPTVPTVIERPTIPSAREETVEIKSVPPPPPAPPTAPTPGPGATTTASAPAQSERQTVWPARPAPDDAAAEVWALVEKAQAGDAEAFGRIYDRYMDTVFRFIYFRVGSRPLAEDLTADTFLRALKRIGSFTWQGRDLGAWLVTIARNLVADHFKSGRYRLEVTTGDVLDADTAERGPEGSPELAVVDHITNVALLVAVKQLNPEQQECIVLRFLQGFSVAETAQAMGKNEGAIKALQYRAVRALHRLLPDGFQP
jgi:RNA polymerase sigma-70 factor (ECF subfamily)